MMLDLDWFINSKKLRYKKIRLAVKYLQNKNRILYLDVARTIAILLVVFTHVHEQIGINNDIMKSIFYSIDRMGVPIFFMLSGGLILPKLTSETNYFKFYKKRIPQFIILLFFYSVLTTTVQNYLLNKNLSYSFIDALKNYNGIFPLNSGGAIQLWFMHVIIQFYFFAPFLAKLLNKLSNKEIIILLMLSLMPVYFRELLRVVFNINLDVLNIIGIDFLTPWLVYFLIGYLIIERKIKNFLYLDYIMLIVPIVLLTIYEIYTNKFHEEFHWYSTSIFIFISSVGLFSLIKYYFEKSSYNKYIYLFFFNTSKLSFGIYLIHHLILYFILYKFKNIIPKLIFGVKYLFVFIIVFLLSYIIVYLISKNKNFKFFVQ